MIRTLTALAALTLLVACQPASGDGSDGSGAEALPDPKAVPDSYDWSFVTHGGSADLDFGDGDWAEGVSLLHLSCLPDSQKVQLSWDGSGDAVLTSGTATGTFHQGVDVAADHPVFSALRSGETLAVGVDNSDMTLNAKAEGETQLEAFFHYCTTPLPPPPPEPVAETPPSEGDDQADDLAGVKPVEPPVDVVEGDGPAHEAVNR